MAAGEDSFKINFGSDILPLSSAPIEILRLGDNMERITANKDILGGKPIIKGTRISVEFILELLASGVNETEILRDYPI